MNQAEAGDQPSGSGRGTVPSVSVCIPLYMKERFVAATIRSILDQTFTDFELVILHNASPDRSLEIAESFGDPRIRIEHNAETIPGAENVKEVIARSRAPLVKVVAADDLLHPTVLEKQVEVLRDPGIVVVSCRQNMVDEHGAIIYADRSLRSPDLLGRQDRQTVLRRVVRHTGNPVGAYNNLMFRRDAYEAIGGMPEVPWMAQDVGLAVALLEVGDFFGMDETLVDFRIASGSESAVDGRAGISDQVRFIRDLRRDNGALLRRADLAYGSLRSPLMQLRHRLILHAAGPRKSVRTRAATRLLSLSRETSP